MWQGLEDEDEAAESVAAELFHNASITNLNDVKSHLRDTHQNIFQSHTIASNFAEHAGDRVFQAMTAYKPVANRRKPIPMAIRNVAPQKVEYKPIPRIVLPPFPTHPPSLSQFPYSTRLTKERLDLIITNIPEKFLSSDELHLLLWVLSENENAVAFDEIERGTFKQEFFPDYIMETVEHTPWRYPAMKLPEIVKREMTQMLIQQKLAGNLEDTRGSYRSRIFAVKKHSGGLRIVHDLQPLNEVSVADASLPPNIGDFAESFVGYSCMGTFDLLSGFYQRVLAESSRALTACNTPIGNLQLKRLPVGYTNSMQEFQRTTNHTIATMGSKKALAFVDDIGLLGSRSRYDDRPIPQNKHIRQFIWEYAQNLYELLATFIVAGCTASGKKMVLATPIVHIVGYLCSIHGMRPHHGITTKVLNWPTPRDTTELRGFLGTAGVARQWIKDFAAKAAPMTHLTRKTQTLMPFVWTEEAQRAMDEIKTAMTTMPALRIIDTELASQLTTRFDPKLGKPYEVGQIVLAVDTSSIAVGYVLAQVFEPKSINPIKYGSITLNGPEKNYSQAKLELLGVYKAIKAVQIYLYDIQFVLEVDALYLERMVERPDVLPNAPMNRWAEYVKGFHPIWVHKTHRQHAAADGLSRRQPSPEDSDDTDDDLELDEGGHYIRGPRPGDMEALPLILDEKQARTVRVNKLSWVTDEPPDVHVTREPLLPEHRRSIVRRWITDHNKQMPFIQLYSAITRATIPQHQLEEEVMIKKKTDNDNDDSEADFPSAPEKANGESVNNARSRSEIWKWLISFLESHRRTIPKEVPNPKAFTITARKYFLFEGKLWRQGNGMPQLVVTEVGSREELIKQAHDDSGHRGRDPTYAKISDQFWWPEMYKQVTEYCHTCQECQMRSSYAPKVVINPTYVKTVLRKLNIDVVHMGVTSKGYTYIVDVRDDLTGWIEARRLKKSTSQNIAEFLWEDVICRFGCIPQITTDNGKEFMGAFQILTQRYGIPIVHTSPYNPAANGMIERGHRTWIQSIWKLCKNQPHSWSDWFFPALWADRVSIRRTTGFSPYHLLYGSPHVFPFSMKEETWYLIPWEDVNTRVDLIAVRALQLQQLGIDREEAVLTTIKTRRRAAHDYAKRNQSRLTTRRFKPGELVIVTRKRIVTEGSNRKKSDEAWSGPYKILDVTESGSYILTELSGEKMNGSVPARHLKFFRVRDNDQTIQQLADQEEPPSSEDDGDRRAGDSDYEEQ